MFGWLAKYWLVSFLLLCTLQIIKKIVEYNNIFYVLTTQRIIRSKGVFTDKITNVDYSLIENIQLNVGIFDKMCETGSIWFKIKGKNTYIEDNDTRMRGGDPRNFEKIVGIDNSQSIYNKLKEFALDFKADIHFPNEYRSQHNRIMQGP